MPENQVTASNEQMRYYPYSGMFYAHRGQFWTAGQDSWTRPPAQDQDKFISLLNVEPVLQGILQRRRGYQLFSAQAPSIPFQLLYSFRSESRGLRRVVLSSTATVIATDESGNPVSPNPIFTPTTPTFTPRMVLSRDFGYFADGSPVDSLKWDGTGNSNAVTNWGIDVTNISSTSFGPNTTGTVTQAPFGATVIARATTFLNGWGPFGHVGAYEGGVNQGNCFPCTDGSTTHPYSSPGSAFDGNNFTAATASYAHTHQYAGCVWKFPAVTPTGNPRQLNILSAVSGPTTRSAGIYYSLNSGSTWTRVYDQAFRGKTLDSISLAPGQDLSQVQVLAFLDSHDDMTQLVYELYITESSSSAVWSNLGNMTACDGANGTVSFSIGQAVGTLTATNFGFAALTNQTIIGIQVSFTYSSTGTGGNTVVGLTLDGTTFPATRVLPDTTGTATATLGSSTDLWGFPSLTPAQVQTGNFGVILNSSGASGTPSIAIDCIQITVFVIPGLLSINPGPGGNINLQSGRTYFYAFQNSNTGHTSSLSKASLTTGPLTNSQVTVTNIPTCLDPQVDLVLLLATADGNDQTTLFLVSNAPNGTGTIIDNTPDAYTTSVTSGPTLLTNPLYLDTDSTGVIHGIANDNRPPIMNFPVKHKGRIYGAIGSTLLFSKSLDDVTTANGLVTAKWEEAWPAANQLDVSEFAETIQGLLSDGETLWIGTERNIRRLVGDGPQNFQRPEIQFNETGLINQETWKVVFYEGQPVGTMWLTPDFRVMASDFNTYEDVGGPVQNILNSINPAGLSNLHASFVSQGPSEYYMLYLPISSSVPDTILVYNLRTKRWVVWSPTDNPMASTFLIDATGTPRWLFSSNAGNVYEWKQGTLQDMIGVSPTTYSVTVQTSWMDFGASNMKKALNQLLVTTDDSGLTVQIDGVTSASEAQFTSPDPVFPATAIVPAPFRENFVPLASTVSYHKFYRFTFTSPASTANNILAAYSAEVVPLLRY